MERPLQFAFLAALLCACAVAPRTGDDRDAFARKTISGWSDAAHLTALRFMQEYGAPDRIESSRLVWNWKGPWARTEVWDSNAYDYANGVAVDLEQTVKLYVPSPKRGELAVFSKLLRIPETGDEITAACGSEELDFLAINLAHEVIAGEINADDARRTYERTKELAVSGKTSPYLRGLIFEP